MFKRLQDAIDSPSWAYDTAYTGPAWNFPYSCNDWEDNPFASLADCAVPEGGSGWADIATEYLQNIMVVSCRGTCGVLKGH